MSTTDRSLVSLVRSGDESAANELYERYAARVFGLVRSQMSDRTRAHWEPEDIVQSIFKSVFRGMNAGTYDAPPGGTLWKLIAVIAVHKVRRNARRSMSAKRDIRRVDYAEDLDLQSSPLQSIEQMEMAITESLECLKPAETEVVILRVRGFSIEEIAEQTNRSRRTVERLLCHARQRLAEVLCETDEVEG